MEIPMRCPRCDAENPDGAKYCNLCYAPFADAEARAAEERARRMGEKHRGAMLRCPNCEELSPPHSQFCLRCGFIFEDPESILVPEEEVARLMKERGESVVEELREIHSAPIRMGPGSEGAEIMRVLEDILSQGNRAYIHARGRMDITHAMKILALFSEERRREGKEIYVRVRLLGEEPIVHLDDVELEIIVEERREAG